MNLRLRHDPPREREPGPAAATNAAASGALTPAQPAPSIGGWLGVFATMLPRRQAESIREELETHLRERVRDLMVGGLNEAESTRRAIAELGEAAELAGKYRALANEPRRRIAMYGTVFAVAGAALALSISAVTGGRQPEAELAKAKAENEAVKSLLVDTLVRQPGNEPRLVGEILANVQPEPRPQRGFQLGELALAGVRSAFVGQPAAPEIESLKLDVKFEETPAEDVFKFVGEAAGLPVQMNWNQLEEVSLQRDTRVTLRANGASAAVILRAINEARQESVGAVDWRARNGVLVIGSRDYFDRQEVKLVIYDLENIIAARRDKYGEERAKIVEEVVMLVSEFVYPEGWRDNGGDLAKKTVVGDRMFVEAPERYHTQIKWMLDQLPGQKPRQEGNAGDTDIQRYIIQHIDAAGALKTLKTNQAIRAINFADFFVDDRTNCVLGRVTAEQDAMVRAVLGQIDTEEAAQKESKQSALPNVRAETVYVTGPVPRPGAYGLSEGLTLRRLMAAAGGLPREATEVIISESSGGTVSVVQTVKAAQLHAADGPDPVIKRGQLVSVR